MADMIRSIQESSPKRRITAVPIRTVEPEAAPCPECGGSGFSGSTGADIAVCRCHQIEPRDIAARDLPRQPAPPVRRLDPGRAAGFDLPDLSVAAGGRA